MKIAHIIVDLDTGGAEMMLYKLVSGSNRQVFSHSIISMIDEGTIGKKIKTLGVPVYCLGMERLLPSPSAVLRLARMVRSIQPDIIQGWMYHGNLLSLIASKMVHQQVPVIWNIRQSLYSLSYEKLLTRMVIRFGALLSGHATRILYNSSTSAGHHGEIGYNAEKSIIIPNGFDIDTFVPSTDARGSVRQELGLDADTLLIGLIGRYHVMKDHGTFLKAASLLNRKHPEVHFLLVGTDVTPQNERLKSLIHEGGIWGKVHLLGEREDIPRLTSALDCAALSSFAEGFPNVVGEAMSSSVPCVVTDVGDAARIVGDTGMVVPPQNPELFAAALEKLVEMGDEKRKVLGYNARQRIIENFSLDSVVRCYEQLYTNLVTDWT